MKSIMRFLIGAWALAIAACDPVHSDAVSALGDDPTGARNGPLHRPGQPCLLCHAGDFSVAGTIYLRPSDAQPVNGATVSLTDATGSHFDAVTNAAGNFYVDANQWTPQNPMQVSVTSGGTQVVMQTLVGRDGSCAGCHVDPAGPASPGRIYITLDDGGAPP